MTRISERKVQSRTAGRDHAKSLESQLDAFQCPQISLQGEVTRSVSTNWQQIAIPRFFADYVSQSNMFTKGNFRFLPDIYNQRMSSPHFDEALRAVAFMSLANQLGKDDLSVEARKLYGSAIVRVATQLHNVEGAIDDTVIASSLLFSLFEMISIKAVPKGFWNVVHDFGRISLLRARGKQKSSSSVVMNLFSLVLVHHMIKCISSHTNPREELLLWIDQSRSQDVDRSGPCVQFLKCSWGIAKFCATAQVLFDSTKRDEQWVLNLLQLVKGGIAIEKACEEWSDSTLRESAEWSYKACRLRFIGAKISQKYPPYFYHDTYVAWTWNYFRACRIRLHEVLLHCITLIQSHPRVQSLSLDPKITSKESRSIIAEMVFDICCSTYFCVGQINSEGEPRTQRPMPHWGYQALWPFYVAMISAEEGSESKAWFQDKLEYITKSMGIELAGMLAKMQNTDPWDIR
ncbi:hypothetical protein B7463_g9420, partial [Scytalidium lignicola]